MMKRISLIVAFVWIALLTILSGITLWNLVHAKRANAADRTGSREWLHGELLGTCAFHDEMIHLYGGWARVSGRSVCNGVFRHRSGMLVNTHLAYADATVRARRLKALCDDLSAVGKRLLYVQFPLKIDRRCKMLPKGFAQDFSHESVDGLLKQLDSLHVPFLDVRGTLDSTPEDVQRHFFKTDHHWNFDGAFKVFPAIAEALVRSVGASSTDITPYISPDAWERKKLPRCFLGTDGRRTGALFAGTDEIFYYVPKFKTSISKTVPSRKISRHGVFEESVMDSRFAEKPPSMLQDSAYCIYGADYDYVKYENVSAPVKKNLLIAKDSFALPVVAWLATVFARVDVVDLRHYGQMTLAEASRAFGSDIVAVMYNPMAVVSPRLDELWRFGVNGGILSVRGQCPPRDVHVPVSSHPYNNVVFEDGLTAKGLYKVSAKFVEITAGTADRATIALLDKKTGKAVKRVATSLASVEWIVDVPDDNHGCAILLYAGEAGKCAGVGAIWHDVELVRIK